MKENHRSSLRPKQKKVITRVEHCPWKSGSSEPHLQVESYDKDYDKNSTDDTGGLGRTWILWKSAGR